MVYRHTAFDLLNRNRLPPGKLEIFSTGRWYYKHRRSQRTGCLSRSKLGTLRRLIAAAKLAPLVPRRCRAINRIRHQLTIRNKTVSWKTPCGHTPPPSLSRLLGGVSKLTGVVPHPR